MRAALARAAFVTTIAFWASIAEAQFGLANTEGFTEGEALFTLGWEVSAPVGDFNKFISDWGPRGLSVEGRYMLTDRISIGGSVSGNRWSQTIANAIVDIPNGTLSGPVYRYADMFGVRALAHYYFTNGGIQPYLGVGLGGVWSYSSQQIVDMARSNDSFDLIVDPEIGMLYQLYGGATSMHLNVALRYTFTTASLANGGKNAQWLSIPVVGLAWSY